MILFLLFLCQALAQEHKGWMRLQEARLLLSEPSDIDDSIDIFNELLAQYPQDDPLYIESLYWKGRALYLLGFEEHSREEMIEASNNYSFRPSSLYFLQQSAAWTHRIERLPYSGNPWVNIEGGRTEESSLAWWAAFDARASRVREVSIRLKSSDAPFYVTVELVDWRNERWVWRDIVQDDSQPLSLRIEQFRSPRAEKQYLYRNISISAETLDGRRIPIDVFALDAK